MDINSQKERLSLSYIETVASQAGYQVTEVKVDRDSVDGILIADFGRRPRIEFQAKATSRDIVHNDTLHFPLELKNYNDLRRDTINPRILIIFIMPEEKSQWVSQTDDELCLRHCAYWLSLEGSPGTSNTSSVTVYVPMVNIFNSEQLASLMQKAERGEPLC